MGGRVVKGCLPTCPQHLLPRYRMGVLRKILVTHMEVLWAAERRRFQEASRFQVSCTLANFVHKCSFAGAFIFSIVARDSTIRLLSRASKT
jgi:hypothetical protein